MKKSTSIFAIRNKTSTAFEKHCNTVIHYFDLNLYKEGLLLNFTSIIHHKPVLLIIISELRVAQIRHE